MGRVTAHSLSLARIIMSVRLWY